MNLQESIRKILREGAEAPYGGKMSNTGLLYSKLEDLKRHGIYKGNEKYDKILKQIEDAKKSGENYKEPKKGFFKSKIDDYQDKKRYDEMSDFEKKIYDYQKDYDNIDKRLLQYVSDFKIYYSDVYGDKLGNFMYKPKITDKEIAKFLTKHYREDIYPKLTGLYKNKILTHGTKDYKSLDVIDIDKHISTGTGNYGHFGKGLYLTSSRDVGKHYGRTQPLVLHNIQKPFFIIPKDKNHYGSHDFEGMQFNAILKLGDIDKNIIPSEDDDNQKLLKTIETNPKYKCVGYAETIPKLDKQWEQNGKKNSLNSLMSDLVNRFGISDELAKKLIKYAEINQEESFEFASLTGSKNVDTVYSQGKHDLIVTNKNTSGEGLDRFMDAEVVVKDPKSVVSIFPTLNAIMKSDGNSIYRDLTSPNIHNESHRKIKNILKEVFDSKSTFKRNVYGGEEEYREITKNRTVIWNPQYNIAFQYIFDDQEVPGYTFIHLYPYTEDGHYYRWDTLEDSIKSKIFVDALKKLPKVLKNYFKKFGKVDNIVFRPKTEQMGNIYSSPSVIRHLESEFGSDYTIEVNTEETSHLPVNTVIMKLKSVGDSINESIRRILREDNEVKSNYQKVINNFKRILPEEYSDTLDEVFNYIRSYIEQEGFTLKVLNNCVVPFKGVRTRNFIIICSPEAYISLADLVYVIFHEIRHEIQMGRLGQINPLSGDLEDFDELYEMYWDMELDAHNYGLEWVDKIANMINLPENYYRLSPAITNYPTMGHMIRNQLVYINRTIQDLKQKGYDYSDISDLPDIKKLLDKLEDLF